MSDVIDPNDPPVFVSPKTLSDLQKLMGDSFTKQLTQAMAVPAELIATPKLPTFPQRESKWRKGELEVKRDHWAWVWSPMCQASANEYKQSAKLRRLSDGETRSTIIVQRHDFKRVVVTYQVDTGAPWKDVEKYNDFAAYKYATELQESIWRMFFGDEQLRTEGGPSW